MQTITTGDYSVTVSLVREANEYGWCKWALSLTGLGVESAYELALEASQNTQAEKLVEAIVLDYERSLSPVFNHALRRQLLAKNL